MAYALIGLFLVGLFLTSLVLPWLHRNRLRLLEEDVLALKQKLFAMKQQAAAPPEPQLQPSLVPVEEESTPKEPLAAWLETYRPVTEAPAPVKESIEPAPVEMKSASTPKRSFEQQFGMRLPVWIGGVALALAGFFLVKYSIENNILTEQVRVILGMIFGVGLLSAAQWVRARKGIANGYRIAQALSGAGIADLYVCLFAATSLYELIPQAVGFAGMAVTTGVAVVLSLRHGAPIALLGLVGGFLTPALVGSHSPNAPLLFMYLYFVIAGLLAVIKKQHWWILSLPTIGGGFLWVICWLMSGHYSPVDSVWLGLFLIAVSATVVVQTRRDIAAGEAEMRHVFGAVSILNYFALGSTVLLMAAITIRADFGLLEWGLFGLLAAGGIGLAAFDRKTYGFVPWLSMVMTALMLAFWRYDDVATFQAMLTLFALLYAGSGYVLLWRAPNPLSWAGLSAGSALIYYLLGYYELHHVVGTTIDIDPDPAQWMVQMPFWGLLALMLALLSANACQKVWSHYVYREEDKQRLLALFAATATAFVSIGLTIELEREFLSVAFAAEVLALAWIHRRIDVKALRYLAGVMAVAFGVVLIPQILLLAQLTAYSLTEARLHLQEGVPIVDWPLFQLGVPAALFIGAGKLLRGRADGALVKALETAAVGLVAVMGYYLTRHAFHVPQDVLFVKASFFERGVITNILFLYGLACLLAGRWYSRAAISRAGEVLCGIALFRIGYFDLFMHNPLWTTDSVGPAPLLNALLLPYGLPIIWTCFAMRELRWADKDYRKFGYGVALILGFVLVSMNVRQLFQGEYLDGTATNPEVYSYSAAWLLMGLGLLFAGTLRQDKSIRVASLVLMILTVGKVFLYDASELAGLYRVFSFLGLGLSLLGLSWFYTRFVFGMTTESKK